MGMRATRSDDTIFDHVFVPDSHVVLRVVQWPVITAHSCLTSYVSGRPYQDRRILDCRASRRLGDCSARALG
jgi:alkylation response protein AidB-like acyl-CoA dehydrogenase